MRVVIVGDKIYERFGRTLQNIADRDARRVLMRALNRGGDQGRTAVRRSLVEQTGIKYGMIHRAVHTARATPADLTYMLIASGNETNLSLFGARQRKKGVSAAPWKRRRLFRNTFIIRAYGGKVFKREGKKRGPLDPLWGPNIAREVVRDPTLGAWATVGPFVLQRVGHELSRLFARR